MNKTWMWVGIILGIVFLWIGWVYATHNASDLPHFYPGYDATLHAVHTKHSIAAFVLAVLSFIFAWFQGGKKSTEQ